MKRSEKRIPWWAFALGALAAVIIASMVIQRQRNDLAILERTLENMNTTRIRMQYEQSEKQREVNISQTSDYIASHARENGYAMPNEIRFIVQNPEALTHHETLDQVQLVAATATPAPAVDHPPADNAEASAEAPAEITEEPLPEPETPEDTPAELPEEPIAEDMTE